MNLRRALLVCALSLATVASASGQVAQGASNPGHVDRALATLARTQPTSVVRVIVQSRLAADATAAVQAAGGTSGKRLPYVGGLVAQVRADRIEILAQQPGIERVMLDPPMRLVANQAPTTSSSPTSFYPDSVGASTLWSQGRTGQGVGIAVIDSGIQAHADFGTPTRVVASYRFNLRAASASDQLGHGTWVAAIAAGSGAASGGRYSGIAPGASIVNLKVSDDTGAAYASDVVEALGWVARNHAAHNIRVVNLSLLSSVSESYATNVLAASVEMLWHAGVVVVAAAGNAGADTVWYPPANDPYIITVGATDEMKTRSPSDNTLAWFSSFGLTQDKHARPDLVAPGRHIIGPLARNGAGLAKQFPAKVIEERYIQLSGTSASAPVVSGAVALLLQAHPHLTPDQVKWLLTSSARPLSGSRTGSGAGELSASAAATLATGQVGRANVGLTPNRLVGLAYLAESGQPTVSWDSVSWDSVSWDSVSWDSVSWDSVSWDSVSWDSVSWDSVSWDSVLGDD